MTGRDVIAWLATPDGEQWSLRRVTDPLQSHAEDSGVFADVIPDVIPDCGSASPPARAARWPEPDPVWDLDDSRWWE